VDPERGERGVANLDGPARLAKGQCVELESARLVDGERPTTACDDGPSRNDWIDRADDGGTSKTRAARLAREESVPPYGTERVLTFQEATRRFQASLLTEVLADCGWNVTEAARRLRLARSHVYNLIRVFGLTRAARSKRLP